METRNRVELPEDIREILAFFRRVRGMADRDLWQSVASQLRIRSCAADQIQSAMCELVGIDMRESWRAAGFEAQTVSPGIVAVVGGRVLEDYIAALPELRMGTGIPIDLVLLEYEVRSQSGQTVDPAEYGQRFPLEWPTLQAQLMQTLVATDNTTSFQEETRAVGISASSAGTTLPSVPPQSLGSRGVAFGDYELLHEIARGGMGVVYKARQTKLNRIVAVKMILAGQLASEEHVRRFYSEAESAAKLDHPGIVPIYEVGKVGDQHFFSMGFVDGAGLAERVSRGPLTPEVAATLVKAIAEATAYAHQQGVIHRDLKPQNILITADGHPKITDFGLAKTTEGDSGLTATGQILGTPSYMPPEQAAGRISDIGPASDVYSLGAVLYCLLTGRPPFQSPNVMETLKQVLSKEPVSPRLLSPGVNRDLETICLKCLEKDPVRRLKSAQELADELGRYLRGEPIRSRRVGAFARAGRWCGRNPLATALSTAVLVLIGLSGMAWMMAQEAVRTKKITAVEKRIQQMIDTPELTETYLKLGESILNEITDQDRAAADAARERLHSAFINQVAVGIHKSKLEPDQLTQLAVAIALIDKFQPDRAGEFKKLLDQRARHWVPLFDLKAPFPDLGGIFETGQLAIDQQRRLFRLGPAVGLAASDSERKALAAAIWLKVEVAGDVRLEAVFDAGWRDVQSLGVACGLNGEQGYTFMLQRSGSAPPRPSGRTAEQTEPAPLAEAVKGSTWALRLMRNGAVLREQFVESTVLTGDTLRLLATREEDRITLQVNDLPALFFDDAFALSRARPGALGLIVPTGIGVTRLTAARLPRATSTNPLDRGNDLYAEGEFEEALAHYQEVALSDSNLETLQEARYKQANCLTQLGRKDEATPLLMQLFSESGNRWPMLSGTLLWVSLIREKRLADAEGVYERLATQYPFERLAALVTDDMRREILAAYRPGKMANVVKGMAYAPTLVRDMERMWIVQKLLQPSGPAYEQARGEIYQVYLLAGDLERATRLVDEAFTTHKSDWAVAERIRLLRYKGRSEEALRQVETALVTPDGQMRRGSSVSLLMNRIRCHADLKQWDQVDKDIREYRTLLPSMDWYTRGFLEPDVRLIEGLLLSKYGDHEAAIAAWRAGLHRDPTTGRHIVDETSEYHLLRSLSGDLDLPDASYFLTKFEGPQSGNLGTMLQSALTPVSLVPALRDMWNSPRGQDWVEKFVFQKLLGAEEVRVKLILVTLEYIRLNAFRGQMSEAQEDAIWTALESAYQAVTVDATFTVTQVLPLALTWKGNTTVFAWDAVAAALPPPLRAQLAYLFAHRFLHLGRPLDSMKFLKITQQNAKPGSPLATLAKADLELLESGVAVVRLRSRTDLPMRVTANREGGSPESVEVVSEAMLRLRPGAYELQIASPLDRHLRFANPRVEVVAGETTTAEIESPWNANPRVIPLPGVVPSPAQIPGVRRWQLVSRESPGGWNCARINPEQTVVAVGGKDGHVRLWDIAAQRQTKILLGHTTEVRSLAWHPHEPRLAAGGGDGTAHLWNTVTGHHEGVLRGHTAAVYDVAWSPDGRHLITAGAWGDGSVRLWSDTGIAGPLMPVGGQISAVSWSPDSKMFATVGTDRHVRVWDLQGRLEHAFESPDPAELLAVAWSPDGQTLATGGRERTVRLWNVLERVAGPTFLASDSFTLALVWNADGSRVAVGTQDGFIAIHDKQTQARLHRSEQSAPIASMQWSPDFTRLFTTAWDGTFRFWRNDCQPLSTHQTTRFQSGPVAWSPDQKRCVVNDPGRKIELREQFGPQVRVFPQEQPEPATIVWSPDGRWIGVSLHHSRTISIWNSADGSIPSQTKIDGEAATLLAWNSESTRLAIASSTKTIHVLDLEGNMATPITNLPHKPRALSWKPMGASLSVSYDQQDAQPPIQSWELQTMKVLDVMTGSYGAVDGLRWSPTGKHFATIHGHQVVIWDAEGRTKTPCMGHSAGIHDMCWRPDGQALATAGWDRTGRIWNLDGVCTGTLTGHTGPVERIHWGTDSGILTASGDQTARVWNGRTGQLRATTLWLPEGNTITVGNTGEVLRQTSQAREHVAFVVERPLGEQAFAASETLAWDEFERTIGIPLERPQVATTPSTKPPHEQ